MEFFVTVIRLLNKLIVLIFALTFASVAIAQVYPLMRLILLALALSLSLPASAHHGLYVATATGF
jgi:hypothetical protein